MKRSYKFIVIAALALLGGVAGYLHVDPEVLAVKRLLSAMNHMPQQLYGKVVDQHGLPVEGVEVTGVLEKLVGYADADVEERKVITDALGLFQFTGLRGSEFGVILKKPGYVVGDRQEGYPSQAAMDNSTAADRAVFTIWKWKGAEPLIQAQMFAYIPCDGQTTKYSLLTGKSSRNGHLSVRFLRIPVNIHRGSPFDWTLTIQVEDGGLLECKDAFAYEAPVDGYKQIIVIEKKADDSDWHSVHDAKYYIRFNDPVMYGLVSIRVTGDFQPPPTRFSASVLVNPTSRNLEFDPEKVVKVSATEEDDDNE